MGNTIDGYTNIWTYTTYDVFGDQFLDAIDYDIYYKSNESPVAAAVFVEGSLSGVSPSNTPHTVDSYEMSQWELVISAADGKIYREQYNDDTKEYKLEDAAIYSTEQYYFITRKTGDFAQMIIKNGHEVTPAEVDNFAIPYLVKSAPLSGITNRYVTLRGFYYQNQQLSWESYR